MKSIELYKDKDIKKILIRGADSIGDAILTFPAILSVRKSFPSSKISVVSSPTSEIVYKDQLGIDEVLVHDQKTSIIKQFYFWNQLRKEKFDVALLLSGAFHSALWTKFINVTNVGIASDHRKLLLNFPLENHRYDEHQVYTYFSVVEGLLTSNHHKMIPYYHVYPKYSNEIKKFLSSYEIDEQKKIVVINPFASEKGKIWQWNKYLELIKFFIKNYNYMPVIVGSNEDNNNHLIHKADIDIIPEVQWWVGQLTLNQIAALLKMSALYVGNNSGIMHLASAVGCKVICISGHSNTNMNAPFGENHIVVSSKMNCCPCSRKKMQRCKHLTCLNMITPNHVLTAIKQNTSVIVEA